MDQVRFLFTAAAAFCAAAFAIFAAAAPRGEVFDQRSLAALEATFRARAEMRDVRLSFFWSDRARGPGLRVRYCPDSAVFRSEDLRGRRMKEIALTAVLHHPETFAVIKVVAVARPDLLIPTDQAREHRRRFQTAEISKELKPAQILHYGQKAWPIDPGVRMRDWKWIVIHHTDSRTGNAAGVERWHRRGRGWEHGMGYHFLIGNGTGSYNGEVEVLKRWPQQLQGAHVGKHYFEDGEKKEWNGIALGIALVGKFEEDAPRGEQMDSLLLLVRYLVEECKVPIERVVGHREFPGQHTRCPGANFSTDMFRASLREMIEGENRTGHP